MAQDWYPQKYADRVPFHANLAVQAAATGVARGLTAAIVTQIGVDSQKIAQGVNYLELVDDFSQSVTQYIQIVFSGDLTAPMPPIPTVPAAIVAIVGELAGIEARTRQYAGMIKAAPGYTLVIGELYGIVAPAPSPPGTVSIKKGTALAASQVLLDLLKAGYSLVAVDSRRAGGAWEQIGVVQTGSFLDARAPLVVGQPEQREYRIQGMVNNARVGPTSAVVIVVTVP